MKKQYKAILYLGLMALTTTSCEKDQLSIDEEAKELVKLSNIEVKEGTLVFDSKETFQSFYGEAVQKEESENAKDIEENLYSKEFYSLMPIITEENEERIFNKHLSHLQKMGVQSKISKGSLVSKNDYTNNQEFLDDLFGEETFASLLNQKGEVIVGDSIYKYTDVGLFIFSPENRQKLTKYLLDNEITETFNTDEKIRESFITKMRSTSRGCNEMILAPIEDAGAHYFITPIDDCGGGGGGGGGGTGGGSGGGSGSSSVATPEEINNALKNISVCEIRKPWVANIFGSVKNCYDQYDGDHRVKIKYHDSKYLLAYDIGVKVKHQKKGWTGLWRKQNTTEMAVGINSVSWAYDPPIFKQDYSNFPTNYYVTESGKLFSSYKSYTNAVYQGKKNIPLPELPFVRNADVIVELAVNDFGFLENEREVREFFYKNLFSTAKSLLKQERNKQIKDLVTIITSNRQVWIQYYDFTAQCKNCDKYDKNFDWQFLTPKVKYKFGSTNGFGGGSISLDFDIKFDKPKVTGLNMYGLAKRSGKWHGNKMVF